MLSAMLSTLASGTKVTFSRLLTATGHNPRPSARLRRGESPPFRVYRNVYASYRPSLIKNPCSGSSSRWRVTCDSLRLIGRRLSHTYITKTAQHLFN